LKYGSYATNFKANKKWLLWTEGGKRFLRKVRTYLQIQTASTARKIVINIHRRENRVYLRMRVLEKLIVAKLDKKVPAF
jgi:hypothetical protein